jgi:signal transduction histidine kinase/CheY-like chemotaxis protein
MRLLRLLSIKNKLRLMILVTSTVALLLACALVAISGTVWYKHKIADELATLAELMSYSGQTPLDFQDKQNARLVIDYLRARPDIVAGALYLPDGTVFVQYQRANSRLTAPIHPPAPGFDSKSLAFTKVVRNLSGSDVGAVFLRSDPRVERRFLLGCIGVIGIGVIFATLVAILLSNIFQRMITTPISDLLRTSQMVSREKNYAVRAKMETEDELGELVTGFNEMLGQIQERDEQLRQHRDHLEREVTDRTVELVQAKERAEEARKVADAASQTKSAFLANMSHELRTPLNAIIGYSEMLQEEAEDLGQESLTPDLQKIHGAGKHLLALINDILDLSKIEAGKMTVYIEEFPVAQLAQDVITTLRPLAARNSNALEVDCAPDVGVMRSDATKTRQALFNLLSNACKFTEQGVIRLAVEKASNVSGDSLVFRVSDTGIGMSAAQIENLFQPFMQADASTTRKYGGTGLGLAITKKFCELMGGSLSVESAPGKGSTFTMVLPAASAELPASPAASAKRALLPSALSPLVLVVDDDAAIRELMERALTKEGFTVRTVPSGEEAVALARSLKPQIITLDVMMPGMDGWSVLSALKAEPEIADIPVIMMTMVDEKHVGFALGAAEYLTKPIDWERLGSVLRKYRNPQSSQTVLIVEDDPMMRAVLVRSVEQEGLRGIEAANGRAALERINETAPALILLDLMMPEMDGFEFLDALAARADWRQVPVILITARDLSDEDHLRLTGQVARIVQKGTTDFGTLLDTIKEFTPARVEGGSHGQIVIG